jgi:hypothetical protein
MAIIETKRALERHLMALVPTLPTAFEGVSFEPPSTMYQHCQLRIDTPDDSTNTSNYYRERTEFQVFIVGESNRGSGDIIQRAEKVRAHFPRASTLTEDGFLIHFLRTPTIGSAMVVGTRMVIPIMIEVLTEIQIL